jgi:hypothetical protein
MKNQYLENIQAEEKRDLRRRTFWGFFFVILFTGLAAWAIIHIATHPNNHKQEHYENQR